MARPTSASSLSRLGDFTTDARVLMLAAMAVLIGIGGAVSAWVLLRMIALTSNLVWLHTISTQMISFADVKPSVWMVVAPALGGLIIGLMARFGSEKIRGHGIPEAIEAILIGGSRLEPIVAILKPLSSAISIGTGGPFGAEGPIIMTGGAGGSLFAQFFSLSAAERKTLLVAGACAGMTAVFGTPVAAVLLAVELLLFELKPRSLIPVIGACVAASIVRPFLIGSGALFPFAGHLDLPWWGLVASCIVLGIVAGLQSGLLTAMVYGAEDLFEHLKLHWMWWPVIGGVAVGLGGLIEPRALGVGYDVIGALIANHLVFRAVVAILLVKSVIWVISLGSGTSGGVLAPLLIFGGCVGWLEGQLLPGPHGAWALIGMAAMMGGTMRSPLTSMMFAIELTGDFSMIGPLLVATSTAYALTVLLLKRSILTEKISRRGRHVIREYSVDPFDLMLVNQVMVHKVDTLPADMSVEKAVAYFSTAGQHKSYPLVDANGQVVGMVARADVLRWSAEKSHGGATLFDKISDNSLTVGYADEPVSFLANRMVQADISRVPIVERGTQRLVGLVSRKDLLRILATVRSSEISRAAFFGRQAAAKRGDGASASAVES